MNMTSNNGGSRRTIWVCTCLCICLLAVGILSATVFIGLSSTEAAAQSQSDSSIVFENQTTNGSQVTVRSVTLPSSGFIVLDSTGPGEEGVLEESTIAVSQRLSAGTHQNVAIPVNHSPPGGVVNQTTLNNTGTYEALLYQDSNNNSRFEFITSGRSTDRPFVVGTGSNAHLASDGARIIVEGSRGDPNATPTPTASIRFTDQHTTRSTVTIRSVTLPQGGFIAVHNQSYLYGGDPTQTAIGISRYLPAGTHQNVSVTLVNGSIQQNQTLVAIPSQDTDNNQTYDYVQSDGFRDVPYTDNTGAVTDRAAVTVASSTTPTVDLSSPITPAATTDTPQSVARTDTTHPSTGDGGGSEEGATQWLTENWIIILVAIIVIVVVGGYLLVRQA